MTDIAATLAGMNLGLAAESPDTPPLIMDLEPTSARYGMIDYDKLILLYQAQADYTVESAVTPLSAEGFADMSIFLAVEGITTLEGPDDAARGIVVHFMILTADLRLVNVEVRRRLPGLLPVPAGGRQNRLEQLL